MCFRMSQTFASIARQKTLIGILIGILVGIYLP
jgi:hypothetical protein